MSPSSEAPSCQPEPRRTATPYRTHVTVTDDRYWPLADLRLSVEDVELRPVTAADLGPLADTFPADVDLDPAVEMIAADDGHTARGTAVHQVCWRAMGGWRLDAWALIFAVRAAGRLVGMQVLEGTDFPALRTVDSASWLTTDARGRGIGTAARRAVLAMAFGPLEAEAAISSAWHDNAASLGVSRSLGYEPNGVHLHARPGGGEVGHGPDVDRMVHLRLTRAQWESRGGGASVRIDGYDGCRRFFEPPSHRAR